MLFQRIQEIRGAFKCNDFNKVLTVCDRKVMLSGCLTSAVNSICSM